MHFLRVRRLFSIDFNENAKLWKALTVTLVHIVEESATRIRGLSLSAGLVNLICEQPILTTWLAAISALLTPLPSISLPSIDSDSDGKDNDNDNLVHLCLCGSSGEFDEMKRISKWVDG